MKIFHLRRVQFLPIGLHDAWSFFSNPRNLSLITPARLGFTIVSGGDGVLEANQHIKYKISILGGIRVTWVTEISHVDEPHEFVDVQLKGPYSLWRHRHLFKEVEGGIEMVDEVDYSIPLGFLGRVANWLFVAKQVDEIFTYRSDVLTKHFANNPSYDLVTVTTHSSRR